MRRLAGLISGMGLVVCVACGQTDAGITTAVKSKLAADDTVKAYQVNVDTNNHVVTLKGDVNTTAAKDRAMQIARDTNGVRDVIDQLTVTESAATTGLLDNGGPVVSHDEVKVDASKSGAHAKATVRHGAAETKNGAEKAADKTVDVTKQAAEKTKEGAKKVGSKVKDVFTDKNKDSDHDGH